MLLNSENPEGLKEDLEMIENLKELNSWERIDLALIRLGEKNAAAIDVDCGDGDEENYKKIKVAIENAGLACIDGVEREVEWRRPEKIVRKVIWVAHTASDINKFQGFADEFGGAKDHKNYGRMCGYPETALLDLDDSRDMEKVIDRKDIPAEFQNAEYFPLVHFLLSKDYWREELKVVERWYKALKKYTPGVLEEFVAHKKAQMESDID